MITSAHRQPDLSPGQARNHWPSLFQLISSQMSTQNSQQETSKYWSFSSSSNRTDPNRTKACRQQLLWQSLTELRLQEIVNHSTWFHVQRKQNSSCLISWGGGGEIAHWHRQAGHNRESGGNRWHTSFRLGKMTCSPQILRHQSAWKVGNTRVIGKTVQTDTNSGAILCALCKHFALDQPIFDLITFICGLDYLIVQLQHLDISPVFVNIYSAGKHSGEPPKLEILTGLDERPRPPLLFSFSKMQSPLEETSL